MKTILQELIDTVKNDFNGACMLPDLLEAMKEKGIYLTKGKILTHIGKTLYLDKPNRKSDFIKYNPLPALPEKFTELLLKNREPENNEDIFLLFVLENKYIPNRPIFKEYVKDNYYSIYLRMNWSNYDSYRSLQKKISNLIRETDCLIVYEIKGNPTIIDTFTGIRSILWPK